MKVFDRKFGADLYLQLPRTSGVYCFYNEALDLLYVGKAKNLKRRLGQYRNAKRVKKNFKMRTILADSSNVRIIPTLTEIEAKLLELRIIQERRPKFNVCGVFSFMYPRIGIRLEDEGRVAFCFTTVPDEQSPNSFQYYGAYRSRGRAGDAYFAWVKLLRWVGHLDKKKSYKNSERSKYVRIACFRGIPEHIVQSFDAFLRGISIHLLENLILALVENAHARKNAQEVKSCIKSLKLFWKFEALTLRKACERANYLRFPVPQRDRDRLFIEAKDSNLYLAVGSQEVKTEDEEQHHHKYTGVG